MKYFLIKLNLKSRRFAEQNKVFEGEKLIEKDE